MRGLLDGQLSRDLSCMTLQAMLLKETVGKQIAVCKPKNDILSIIKK